MRFFLLLIGCAFHLQAVDVPYPVLRYTFDAPFGYEEPNAIGTEYPAFIPRNSVQHPAPSRQSGVFGNAIRPGLRQNIKSTFPAGKEFTVSFWMRPYTINAPDIFRLGDLVRIGIDRRDPKLVATVGATTLPAAIKTGEWVCVVFSSSGEEIALYLDGQEVGRGAAQLAADPRGMDMTFAGIMGAHHLFYGQIDEFRVYDVALTSEQVARISDKDQALQTVPPVADAGSAHTVYLVSGEGIAALLEGRVTGGESSGVHWSVVQQPEGTKVRFEDAEALNTRAHFSTPGDYRLQLSVDSSLGQSQDSTRVVVFPPHPEHPPAKLHENPDTPGTYITSSINMGDEKTPPPYDAAFVEAHFPAIKPRLQTDGFSKDRFKAPPAPYVHPRIFFNPEDLPAMRTRIRYDAAAGSAYASVRRMYEMKTRETGLPADYIRKESKEDEPGYKIVTDHHAAAGFCMGAYIALVEGDRALARQLIKRAVAMAPLQNEALDKLKGWKEHYWQGAPNQVLGRYAAAYIYDFLYPWMTPEEQQLLRGVISKATREMKSIGMFTVPQASARSNWVCWVTGDLLVNVLAIEGEVGFDPVVFEEAANALSKFSKYGILLDGSSFEGMGKNSITGQNLVAMAKRGYYAIATENIYNFYARFQLNVMQPYGNQFIADDLWGSSRYPGDSPDAAVMKYAYPDDPVIDFVYRNVVKGAAYQTPLFKTTYAYNSALVNCWFGQEWTGPDDWNAHAAQALEGQLLDAHFNYTNIATARSGWDQDATFLYFLPRMLGGHNSPARGTFVFSALGRDWSLYPTGHNNKSSLQHSVITVDGKSVSANWARMTAFDSNDDRMIAAADLRDYFTNRATPNRSQNDFRVYPAPEPWFDLPVWQMPHWQHGYRPQEAGAPTEDIRPPALVAYRSVALVREERPYALIFDQMNIDDAPHTYRWQMVLPNDLRGHVTVAGNDALITDPDTGHAVLVRPVGSNARFTAKVIDTKFSDSVIVFESETAIWNFAVMLMPLKKGESAPAAAEVPRLKKTLREMEHENINLKCSKI